MEKEKGKGRGKREKAVKGFGVAENKGCSNLELQNQSLIFSSLSQEPIRPQVIVSAVSTFSKVKIISTQALEQDYDLSSN